MSAKKRILLSLAAVLLPLVALGLIEMALRAAGFEHDTSAPRYRFVTPEARYADDEGGAMVRDDALFWRLRPGLRGPDGALHVKDTGYRSGFAPLPEPGVQRIVCLGDSSTFGLQVSETATWSAVAQAFLRAEAVDVEVLNLGVPGYSSHQGLVLLRTEALALRPDVVVCAFGTFNDWVPARGRTDAEQYDVSLASSLRVVQAFSRLLGRRRAEEGTAVPGLLDDIDTRDHAGPRRVSPSEFEANLHAMIEAIRGASAAPVLLTSPLPDETLERNPIALLYAEASRRVARSDDVPIIDGWALFAESPPPHDALFADFCHPSRKGHAVLGAALAETLEREGLVTPPR